MAEAFESLKSDTRLAAWSRPQKLALAACGLSLLLALFLAIPWFLGGIGQMLIYEASDFQTVDAVVLLPGSVPDRALQAADLYKSSRSQRFLLVQGWLAEGDRKLMEIGIERPTHAEINRRVLLYEGVPADQIVVIESHSQGTSDDARALRDYLADNPLQSVALVTCPYHSRRAYWNFEKELRGIDLKIYSIPTRHCSFSPSSWWKETDQFFMVYVEWAKLLAFLLGRS